MGNDATPRISPARLALAVRRLRAEEENLDLIASDPIAIIGMGCRFPGGADSPQEFWTVLREGRDCLTEIPSHRWKDAETLPHRLRLGAYLTDFDGFDAAYFGISPREARHMDPQQRLLLEVTWEALWDAGLEPSSLSGSNAGVYVAIYNNDYARLDLSDPAMLTAHSAVGSAHSVAAGRLSFLLNLKGPSLALDSACSSSLVAVHLACQSLRAMECGLAIVAASSLKLLSDEVQVFAKWGMLAGDGRCKTFDAAADGFGPGEGSGALILKRLSDALQNGDRIRAVIRGTAVNHDGKTTVLTAPSGLAQQAVLRAALKNARIEPKEVSYIETHGTGTSLGDPIEMEAVGAVYGKPEPEGLPCVLGAVKSNLGHLEAAAGIAGMIKTVLCLENGEIPRNLHFRRLNPEISLDGTRLRIAAENLPWKRGGRPRVAGVSSFGLGGTNSHILVEEAPVLPSKDPAQQGRTIPLPAYRWQRQRFWLPQPEPPSANPLARSSMPPGVHPLLGRRIESPFFEGTLYASELNPLAIPWLAEHRLGERPIFPFAAFLETATAAATQNSLPEAQSVAIRNFQMREPLFVAGDVCRLQTILKNGNIEFAGDSGGGWTIHASASFGSTDEKTGAFDLNRIRTRLKQPVSPGDLYTRLEQTGLRYGPPFRVIHSAWRAPGEALAHLRLTEELGHQVGQYGIHPVLLDGCLQTVIAARDEDASELFLPISVDRFELHQGQFSEVWAYTQLTAASEEAISADIVVADGTGTMIARIAGFTARRVRAERVTSSSHQSSQMIELAWRPRSLDAAPSAIRAGDRWLLLEHEHGISSALVHSLTERGAICTVMSAAQFSGFVPGDAPWAGIVYDARSTKPASIHLQWNSPEKIAIEFLLKFARSLSASDAHSPALRIIIHSGFQVCPAEDVSIGDSPLLGMLRTFALEYLDTAPVVLDAGPLQIAPDSQRETNAALAEEIASANPERMVAFRHGTRYVGRVIQSEQPSHGARKLQFGASGRLEDLRIETASRTEPEPWQVQIAVRASGLNFRDVLTAMDMLPARSAIPGAECAGTIVRVGSDVSRWKVGDNVLAFAPASLQSYVNVSDQFVARKPDAMSFSRAAGIPVAFLTALYGLERMAKLSAGQTVLIHAAAGGLGMAALQLATRAGATVFATAGSPEKREFLRHLGVQHVFDSRSLLFSDDVLQATVGRGVDVVLNSLAGELMAASFDVVAESGCLLEVGKRGLWSAEDVAALGKNIRYYPFDLGEVALRQPSLIAEMLDELMERFSAGELQPLPVDLHGFDAPVAAFRTMAQGRHIGKIVLGMDAPQPSETIRDVVTGGTVLITGGLGALGLETARWLVHHGARNIVLAGRSAPTDHPIVAELRALDANVSIERADVADPHSLTAMLEKMKGSHPPITAIFHAAGVVQDSVLGNESWESYHAATAPKIEGAWNLDRLTRSLPIRLMVFYSSAASILGSAGQGSYAAGSAFLDALAYYRSNCGLRTLSVNWGSWASAGMAARLSTEQAARFKRQGAHPMEPAAALAVLDDAIASGRSQVAILNVNWQSFLAGRRDPMFFQELSQVATQPKPTIEKKHDSSFLQEVQSAPVGSRKSIIASHIRQCARQVMALEPSAAIQDDVPLQDIGLDSLMALEMRNELAASLALTLPAGLLFDYPAVAQLAAHLAELLAKSEMAQPVPQTSIESLSDEEAERLLIEELDRAGKEEAHA